MRLRLFLCTLTISALLSGCAEKPVPPSGGELSASASPPSAPTAAKASPRRSKENSSAPGPTSKHRRSKKKGNLASVVRVVDGDTIEVVFKGKPATVRLIGVDTPETVHPSEPVECFGRAASTFARDRLEARRVRLEFDIERFDKYGRTLAYVWMGKRLFNEALVAEGYGQVSTYPPNLKYVRRLLIAERRARKTNRGLWGRCGVSDGEDAGSPAGGGGSERCDASYKGACIRPYPPDLDCDDLSRRGFRVVGPDRHRFDGDGDGIGCETD